MRIMVLSDLYPPHFIGGYELKCKLQAEELAKRGHELIVLTSTWKAGDGKIEGNVYRLLRPDDLACGALTQLSPLSKRFDDWNWALSCRRDYGITREIAAAAQPDLVYIWHMANTSITPILAVQDLGLPMVFRVADYSYAHLKAHFSERNPIKRRYRAAIAGIGDFSHIEFSHILIVSHALMRSYVQDGFPERAFTVLPQGVPENTILNASDLPDRRPTEDRLRLLSVGRLSPEKGIDLAIQAVQHLLQDGMHADVRLDIVGTGPGTYVNQLQTLTSTLGLDQNVKFCGFLKHEQVLASFGEYDAVLIPSLWEEPLCGTIAEAMAHGLPVIATERGGTPEIVSHGQNGLLVPAGDPAALADAIRTLVRDPALYNKIRLSGLNTVRNRFTNERIVDQVEDYFREFLVSRSDRQVDRGARDHHGAHFPFHAA